MMEVALARITAGAVRAQCRIAAMQAANSQYPENQPYSEKDFLVVIDEEGLGHNTVEVEIQNAYR